MQGTMLSGMQCYLAQILTVNKTIFRVEIEQLFKDLTFIGGDGKRDPGPTVAVEESADTKSMAQGR